MTDEDTKNVLDIRLDEKTERFVYSWLMLSMIALSFAGLFAFLLAMARTPQIQDILPAKDYFRVALVDHVVLSIVIWFLTFEGVLWALTSATFSGKKTASSKLGMLGFLISAIGTALLIAPALMGLGTPIFTNYIPVLDHQLYYSGLILFAVGLSIYLVNIFASYIFVKRDGVPLFGGEIWGMWIAGIAIVIALLCFFLAYYTFPEGLKKAVYLEHFFWGGGHILQFAHTIAMLAVWLMLAKITLKVSILGDKAALILFLIFLVYMAQAPFIFYMHQGGEESFKEAFTTLMQYGNGPAVIILLIIIVKSAKWCFKGEGFMKRVKGLPWNEPGFSALFFSTILFATGGLIAVFIEGSNTKIPSHYHGVIGAVTTSFMGITYYILPMMGRKLPAPKLAKIQPYIYGIGQLLFVIGMFWAGSHGVARKTYGAAQGLDNFAKIAGMTLMGIGGLVAITGGAAFVYNILFSLLGKKDDNN